MKDEFRSTLTADQKMQLKERALNRALMNRALFKKARIRKKLGGI